MEQIFLHLPFAVILVVMLLGILYRVCSNARADDKINSELEANRRRVGEAADRAADSRETANQCEEIAEGAAASQRRAEEKVESATDILKSARNRAEKIGGLAEICEEVLSKAKKKE